MESRGEPLDNGDPIGRASELLSQGFIVAVKGLGGFHLVVDAENQGAVEQLRRRKGREEKPFALVSPDLDQVRSYARVNPPEADLLTSIQRPIVLVKKREPNGIADGVSPRNRYFGVMLPYTPLHHLLLARGHRALVMTSGNISEEPICIDNSDALNRLGGIADFFLVHNRDIYLRSDDSIVRRSAGALRFIRRSRGYVPVPVFLHRHLPAVLACGAELKNTICLTKENRAFLSQHIGDLENLETYRFLELTVAHLQRILDIRPEIVACDLHPDYLSTRYANERIGAEKVQVQHHHAHIVSCMAENREDGPVIGLAFDGTGYGADGNIWGGEVLIAEPTHFTRVAHLDYVAMPGGAAAVKEPWRMAVSYLLTAFGESFEALDLPVVGAIDSYRRRTLIQMIEKRVNAPLTSSMGRLFDGVAAIAGIRSQVFYEGQAAMELEMVAGEPDDRLYDVNWHTEAGVHRIAVAPIIRGVVTDMKERVPVAVISARFHATLIHLFTELCCEIRDETSLERVALSGGSFQNDILLSGMIAALEKRGFSVLTHTHVPTNDGGISLGQAVAAGVMAQNG
jgi:hydrogenase maturation protein HypF